MLIVNDVTPALDEPGKGLPRFELWVARTMVGWRAGRATREQSAALFASERGKIVGLSKLVSADAGRRRVLIKRLRGMEDSSRYWSVFMTFDHLRIVNDSIAEIIRHLARNETPPRVASTADVKPTPSADVSVVGPFEQACDQIEQTVDAAPDLHTRLRWPHPWFGPLDAAKWHFVAAFHMELHRRQIEAIRAAL